MPIDLPQLADSHTGEAVSSTNVKTLNVYSIIRGRSGHFILDNTANDNPAIAALDHAYKSDITH